MSVRIKVLTLNCWGVHVAARKRPERIAAIASALSKAEYDVILLQEIWIQSDYELLCSKALTTMPYSHYFHSGVIGSGLCIFSKHPILETQGIPFTLNGYPHRVYHGDWFGRKAVGLAKILLHGIRANFYVTHLHASYAGSSKEYHGHRIAQAFELSQHIKNTSEGCDVVVVCGDFNYTPDTVGYKVIRFNANLIDSAESQQTKVQDMNEMNTCNRPDNSFTNPARQASDPGARIDYIMYRYNTGYYIDCEKCYLTMGKIPDCDFNYSDHEGLAAHLIVKKNPTGMAVTRNHGEIEKHLSDCLPILETAQRKVNSDRVFYILSMFFCMISLTFTADMATSWTLGGASLGVIRTLLTCAIGYFLWLVALNARVELAALRATKNDINFLLKSNPAC